MKIACPDIFCTAATMAMQGMGIAGLKSKKRLLR